MNYSEVKELLQAGFTADEIRIMMNPQVNNPQNAQDNPQAENTNDSETVKDNSSVNQNAKNGDQLGSEQDPSRASAENTNDQKFDLLNSTMEKLIKTIQSSNLNNSSFDSITKPDLNAEVDKIMAGIIRPERDKKEV